MQIYCKWASCRSQFDSVWLQSFILTQLSSTMIKNHCDLYSSFTCEKKSRHLYSVFSPYLFFSSPAWHRCWRHKPTDSQLKRYIAVPQPMLIIIIITVLWVWVSWIEKKKNTRMNVIMTTTCVHVRHIFMQKNKNPWVNHLKTLFMHTGLWAVWG